MGECKRALQLFTIKTIRMSYNYYTTSIIEKIEKFGKSFDKLTKETVKAFLIDSKKSNFKIK